MGGEHDAFCKQTHIQTWAWLLALNFTHCLLIFVGDPHVQMFFSNWRWLEYWHLSWSMSSSWDMQSSVFVWQLRETTVSNCCAYTARTCWNSLFWSNTCFIGLFENFSGSQVRCSTGAFFSTSLLLIAQNMLATNSCSWPAWNDACARLDGAGSSNKKAQKFHEKRVEYQQKYKAALAKHSKKHDDKWFQPCNAVLPQAQTKRCLMDVLTNALWKKCPGTKY